MKIGVKYEVNNGNKDEINALIQSLKSLMFSFLKSQVIIQYIGIMDVFNRVLNEEEA